MKLIPLTQGQFAKVDDEDYNWIMQYNWQAGWNPHTETFYARRGSLRREYKKQQMIGLHRAILGVTDPKIIVDHKNGGTLDCRRKNLRKCNMHQNGGNRRGLNKNSTSGKRGVHWHKASGKWKSEIKVNYKSIYLGIYTTKKLASAAYAAANKKYYGKEWGGTY